MSRGRIIGIISGKGGVGKTSLCVNLGIALKEQGKNVTLVDADFSASNLGVHLGRYDHPVKMQDVLHNQADHDSAKFRHRSGVEAIASSNEIHTVEPDTTRLREILERSADDSDYVLVDCPPGLNQSVESVMDACDELVIVTMPTQTAGINAAQIIEKAKQNRQAILGTVINKVSNQPDKELIDREVEMMTESDTIAKIPYDGKMKEALFHNTPLVLHEPLSEAALEIKELAAQLEGRQYNRPRFAKVKRKIRGLTDALQN